MDPKRLVEQILPHVDHAIVDPLNYRGHVASLFRQQGWHDALTDEYADKTGAELLRLLGEKGRAGG